MLNRVIFGNEVYYKVADLAEIFGVSQYRIKKSIKDQKIETKNDIFGRIVFISEKNLAKIDANGRSVTITTTVKENIKKFDEVIEQVTKKVEVKEAEPKVTEEQKEHEQLVAKHVELRKEYATTEKGDKYNEINKEHLGGIDIKKTTPEDNEKIKHCNEALEDGINEIPASVPEINESPNEIPKVENALDEVANEVINELSNEIVQAV